jgi:diguanylate cyclase (GGDEF)-like protein
MGAFVLNSQQRRRAFILALLGNGLPVLIATVSGFDGHPTIFFVGAAIAVIAPLGVTLTPSELIPVRWLFAFGGLPGLTMLQAYSGGVGSEYAVLLIMATIWFGILATELELRIGLGVIIACCYGPMLIFGSPAYPVDWAQASVLALVTTAVTGSLSMMTRETGRLTKRLRHEAVHDQLTGLFNRRGWEYASTRDLARAARTGSTVTVVLLDLDHLKGINDELGHDAGDRILAESAQRLRDAFRGEDAIARVGGDEFAVLLVAMSPDDAFGAVERLRAATPAQASFSAGIAVSASGEDLDGLMRRADLALYEAKSAGRGRSQVATGPIEPPPSA